METVRASGDDAHGQMASGFSPLLWKTFKKESQEVSDPAKENKALGKVQFKEDIKISSL